MMGSNGVVPLAIPSEKQLFFTKWTRRLEREAVSSRRNPLKIA
jgi:hypothetical protein